MILVVNTKGGSGKSTTAMQLIAPWALEKTGSATVIELDDENHDSADFNKSAIHSERVKVGKDVNAAYAINNLIDKTNDSYVIADIGGNRTSSMALQQIGQGLHDTAIDMIVIPVSGPGRDVKNAKNTLDSIRKYMPKYEGKIMMVFTRTTSTEVDIVRDYMPDAFAFVEQNKLDGPIILPSMNCFAVSRFMGMSVWEIANQGEQLMEDMREAMKAARRNPERRRELSVLNRIVTESMDAQDYLSTQFNELDKILDLKAIMQAEKSESSKDEKKATSA